MEAGAGVRFRIDLSLQGERLALANSADEIERLRPAARIDTLAELRELWQIDGRVCLHDSPKIDCLLHLFQPLLPRAHHRGEFHRQGELQLRNEKGSFGRFDPMHVPHSIKEKRLICLHHVQNDFARPRLCEPGNDRRVPQLQPRVGRLNSSDGRPDVPGRN